MKARVHRWLHNDKPRAFHAIVDGAPLMRVELEVTDPPSRRGQLVHLMLDASDVTALLLELRDAARDARQGLDHVHVGPVHLCTQESIEAAMRSDD